MSVESKDGKAKQGDARSRARRVVRDVGLMAALLAGSAAAITGAHGQAAGTQTPTPPPTEQATPPAPQTAVAPPAGQGPTVFRTRTEEVLVPVLVRNHSGDPVLDLGRKDFRLLEDDVEQKISFFTNDPFPLSVVLLVDDDLPPGAAEKVERSLTAVLGGMAEGDEMAVVLFAQFPRTVADFGSDQDALHAMLKRTDLGHKNIGSGSPTMTMAPQPTTSSQEIGVPQMAKIQGKESKDLDDAVLYSADMLRTRPRERRKMLLIISDGRNSHNNTASYGQALRALLSSDVSVYGVGVAQAVLDRKRAAIGRYVDATGGDIFYAASQSSMEEDYSHILTESRNRYTLAYSPAGTDRSKEFHEIEVKVERPGLRVLARDGYYVLVAKK
ncbi:MAG TPA: VWA domain-containing protein [Candidatus Acidoferrales bacterium]|nr:VWA domain-containing protein [Candidatus Acidoferrales bacterium]